MSAAVKALRRRHISELHRLAATAGVLLRIDRTLPEHCPGRVARHGRRTLLLVAARTSPLERLALLRSALDTGPEADR
ncbi:hypothetical protein [Streptomyces sp. DSM 41013]